MSQEYKKKCRDWGNKIITSNHDWKWMALEMDGIMLHVCKRGSRANGQNQSQGKPLAATGTVKTEVPKSETSELAAAIRELAAAIRQSRNS